MSVLALVLILLFLAAILWAVNMKFPNINPTIKLLLNIVLIAIAVILCLSAFGVWETVRSVKVPHI